MSKEVMNELMEKLKAAKTDEERKQILESSKIVLSENELEQVNGGFSCGIPCTSEFL